MYMYVYSIVMSALQGYLWENRHSVKSPCMLIPPSPFAMGGAWEWGYMYPYTYATCQIPLKNLHWKWHDGSAVHTPGHLFEYDHPLLVKMKQTHTMYINFLAFPSQCNKTILFTVYSPYESIPSTTHSTLMHTKTHVQIENEIYRTKISWLRIMIARERWGFLSN